MGTLTLLWNWGEGQTPRAFSPAQTGLLHYRRSSRLLLPAVWGVGGLVCQELGGETPGCVLSWASFIWEERWPGASFLGSHLGFKTACMTLGQILPCARLSLLPATPGGWSGNDLKGSLHPISRPSDAMTLGESPHLMMSLLSLCRVVLMPALPPCRLRVSNERAVPLETCKHPQNDRGSSEDSLELASGNSL